MENEKFEIMELNLKIANYLYKNKDKIDIFIPKEVIIIRKWAMPNKNTFTIKPIKDLN